MSKVDAQRAMREARYARDNPDGPVRGRGRGPTGGAPAPAAPTAPSAGNPAAAPPRARAAAAAPGGPSSPGSGPDSAGPDSAFCGHKSMNGRACTREAGHPQKSHRYG